MHDLVSAGDAARSLGLAHNNSVTTYLQRNRDPSRSVVGKSSWHIRVWLRQEVVAWSHGGRDD